MSFDIRKNRAKCLKTTNISTIYNGKNIYRQYIMNFFYFINFYKLAVLNYKNNKKLYLLR